MLAMRTRVRPGGTTVIVLLLMAVVVTVVGLTVSAVMRARESSARTSTMCILKQGALGVHGAQDQRGKLPPYYGIYGGRSEPLTFHAHLLPFVEQAALYDAPVADAIVGCYVSQMDPTQTNNGAGAANFAVNVRLYFSPGAKAQSNLKTSDDPDLCPRMPNSFPDGVSNTLLFATKYQNCGDGGSRWLDPNKNAIDSATAATFGASMQLWQVAPSRSACNPRAGTAMSFTTQAIQIAMCDASVKNLALSVNAEVWQAAHTPAGGDGPGGGIDE